MNFWLNSCLNLENPTPHTLDFHKSEKGVLEGLGSDSVNLTPNPTGSNFVLTYLNPNSFLSKIGFLKNRGEGFQIELNSFQP